MPFTAAEVQYLTNTVLEHNQKGAAKRQTDQRRPLYDDMMASKKTFGGGNEYLTIPVKGEYSSSFQGYSHDDPLTFGNPTNVKRAKGKWYEMASGIQVTFTELKEAGIHVQDSAMGENLANASDQDIYLLTNIIEDKFQDLDEGPKRSLAEIIWRDGTQDAKVFPGIQSIILGAPTTGITFGLDRAQISWWRNRASLAINTGTPANQNLVTTLQREFRQLRRYAAQTPSHGFYCGSDFIDAFEQELRAKGNYTLDGWAKSGKIDASVADVSFKGVNLEYEPLLDDLGLAKYGYVLDRNTVKLRPMKGEEFKNHTPARPVDVLAIYRGVTYTGLILADQLNTSGVYSIL